MSTPWDKKNFGNFELWDKKNNSFFWEPKSSEEYFAVFLRETLSISKLADDFGVEESDLSVQHKFQGHALGGQVCWVKPKAGVTVKPTVFAKQCYTITQCISDRLSRAPYLHPQPVETTGFLDRSWNPPKPGFLSIRGGQVDVKNHCCYLPGFGEFEWDDAPVPKELDAIKIRGKWALENIERVQIPQLKGIDGLHRCVIQFNKKAVSQLKMLWQAWEECGLLSKIVMFDAGFVERYQRRCNHTAISNHAFGTAFDINVQWNGFGCLPARLGEYGCVRQLAEVANQYGFYWGGHWGGLEKKGWDGMHFEVAKIM